VAASACSLANVTGLATATAQATIDVWWPTHTAISGIQPFKALVPGMQLSQYQMYWQVDNGQLNYMGDSLADSPHKEASVDVSTWLWHGSGPYDVRFVAKDLAGVVMAQTDVEVSVGQPAAATAATPAPAPTATPMPAASSAAASPTNSGLYVDPNSEAGAQARSWSASNPAGASEMSKIAAQPHAFWFGNWNTNVGSDVSQVVAAAASAHEVPVLVA
jgi:hypothetical protein